MTGGLFRDGDFVISYPRLSDQAAAVAAALVELGVCSDDRVLVMPPDGCIGWSTWTSSRRSWLVGHRGCGQSRCDCAEWGRP